jgi:alkaline phosphatase D
MKTVDQPAEASSDVTRRTFLGGVAGVAGLAAMAQFPVGPAEATPRPRAGGYPFSLGVASGDPTEDSIVLWTRLNADITLPDGGMPNRRLPVVWEMAEDSRFRNVARRGVVWALPQLGHAVHVDVRGLRSDAEFFYRFRYRDEASPLGRTRTAPSRSRRGGRLDFAFASCQAWPDGYYAALGRMAEEDLDLVLHLGDYVYESGIPADGGYRKTAVPDVFRDAPRDLARWRLQYALYKSDPDLQNAHARFPWVVTWDDHEVQNDYANTQSQYEGDISALRAAAYQAWYEHQPVRRPARPDADGPRIYRRLHWGRLAQLDVVDGRQYRSVPPCGWGEADACSGGYDPSVSMLGARQERWLDRGLRHSNARWNLMGSNVMMARLDHDGDAGDRLWHDAWDGYPAARKRITDAWQRYEIRNPLVLTGDWHSTFVNDIRADFDRAGSRTVGTEFVGTSLTSNGDREVYGPYYGPMIGFNPHIKFFDGDRRGYVRGRLTPQRFTADLQMVRTVSRRDAERYTFASFEVEDGVPGARPI